MRPVIHSISLLGILSISLISMTGCAEKRIHVATLSGTPGETSSSAPSPDTSHTTTSGLPGTSVDESSLPGHPAKAVEPIAPVEPLMDFVNEPSRTGHMDESFMKHPLSSPQLSSDTSSVADSDSALGGHGSALEPLGNGKDISTQSGTSAMNGSPHAETSPFTAAAAGQDDLINPQAGMEPIPESFQVAKAEPSDMLRDQLNKIQEEELATASAGLEDVFFQFDSWSLTAEAKESLERDLGWLRTSPSSSLVIEGHADQRGTQAYNMVLGKKRAMAIRDYLSELGVDGNRLSMVSYGKDKPFCQDSTEVCHQLNRRGHLLTQN
jgi:peptidoglycan-associated lipoprotein